MAEAAAAPPTGAQLSEIFAAAGWDLDCLVDIDGQVMDLTQPYTQEQPPRGGSPEVPSPGGAKGAGQKRIREAPATNLSGSSSDHWCYGTDDWEIGVGGSAFCSPPPLSSGTGMAGGTGRGSGGTYYGTKTCPRVPEGSVSSDVPLAKALWRNAKRLGEEPVRSEGEAAREEAGPVPGGPLEPCPPAPPQALPSGPCQATEGQREQQLDRQGSNDSGGESSSKVLSQTEQEVQLSDEQRKAIDAALAGKNLFITGKAGVGKSFLVEQMVKHLNGAGERVVQITASTGIAAVNVGGCTIHSFAGILLGNKDVAALIKILSAREDVLLRWRATGTLIIDEVSMISADLFDKVERVARWTRGIPGPNGRTELHPNPFGGIQVICVGDFLQLPPVSSGRSTATFAFESPRWKACRFHPVLLTKVFRQADSKFVNLLNEVRVGRPGSESLRLLYSLRRPLSSADGITPTILYPLRKDVARENDLEFGKLPGPEYMFCAYEVAEKPEHKKAMDNCQAPPQLFLKVGAQVMMLQNLSFDREIVNGSRGIVIDFVPMPQAFSEAAAGGSPVLSPAASASPLFQSQQHEEKDGAGPSQDSGHTQHPPVVVIPPSPHLTQALEPPSPLHSPLPDPSLGD